jgi:hypothetical protein
VRFENEGAMNTYGWLLLGQTLLALLALGAAGGWALWPFRRADRPFLWLAAPLAGLLVLGGTVTALYFLVGLPFGSCLWLGLALNALATVAVLVRGRPALPSLGTRTIAVVVAIAAAYWGTVSCNKTAIDAREPTLAAMDGSDMFGYAITADWLRAHTAAQPPRPDEPFEVMAFANLSTDGGRPLAFVLTAAGGEARGTGALFSYDWTSGVVLSAALLGLGGAFAPNALMLVLLVAGGGSSIWLANARSGYFGKSLAYPGTVLLAGLFLTTLSRFTRARMAVLAMLGFAVAYALAPVFVAVALGTVAGCFCGAYLVMYPLNRLCAPIQADGEDELQEPVSFRTAVLTPALVALGTYALTVGPAFAIHYAHRAQVDVPSTPSNWGVVIPVALDLEPPALPLLKPKTEHELLAACIVTLLIFVVVALRRRHQGALALLGCALVIPVSWVLGQNLVHTFQGVIYPLTLGGAALLAPPLSATRWGMVRAAALSLVIVGAVGLRVPQVRAATDRYVYSVQPNRTVVRQSDAALIRNLVGTDAVDVAVGHFADNHFVLAELVAHGVEVRLRSPAWDRSIRNWARVVGCSGPDLLAPKARFALVERNAWAPPGTERFVGRRLKLIEDRDAVTILAIADTQEMTWDREGRPGVWIGNAPITFFIYNGTGRVQSVNLHGETSAGPAHPNRDRRTLRWRLGDQTGTLSLPKENEAAIPLRLAPGLNGVELSVEEAAEPEPKPKQPVPLLEFRNWCIESPEPR